MTDALPSFVERLGDRYVLSNNDIVYTVTPSVGGRIESLRFLKKETLLTPNPESDNLNSWGNVFWPSPQSDWGWPPLAAIDHKPYALSLDPRFLILTSNVDQKTHLQVEKSYGFTTSNNTVHIRYRMYNRGSSAKKVAPWEISRFPPSGRVFFPQGVGEHAKGDFDSLPVSTENGITWFRYDADEIGPRDHKLIADGRSGWLAYLNENILLVKIFTETNVSAIAPNEGEIEIFAHGDGEYIEVEQQGEYQTLQPGEHFEWSVYWALLEIPQDNANPVVPDEVLLEMVENLLSK